MAPTVRAARVDELPAVLAFWASATEIASSTDDLEGLTTLHKADPDALLLAVDGATIIGTVIAGWDGWRGSIYRLAVQPDRRRAGVARALLAAAEARLGALGCRRVSLYAVREHERAMAFWSATHYEEDPKNLRFVARLGSP